MHSEDNTVGEPPIALFFNVILPTSDMESHDLISISFHLL